MRDKNNYPTVSIIVLNWNGWENSIECLESVYKIDYPSYHLILVDNASKDESIAKIREYCDGKLKPVSNYVSYTDQNKPITVREIDYNEIDETDWEDMFVNNGSNHENSLLFLKNDENYGLAGGNNIAIKFAMDKINPDYVLLLNNDTVVDKKFLNELIQVAQKDSENRIYRP